MTVLFSLWTDVIKNRITLYPTYLSPSFCKHSYCKYDERKSDVWFHHEDGTLCTWRLGPDGVAVTIERIENDNTILLMLAR